MNIVNGTGKRWIPSVCAAKSGLCSHNLFLHFRILHYGCILRRTRCILWVIEHNGTVWLQTVPFFIV